MTEPDEPEEIPPFDGGRVLASAADLLAGFDAASVTTLLHAACSSPTARQAMATCAALLMSSWVQPPAGAKSAGCADLAPLIEGLRSACPDLAAVEDFVALDPRETVRFRVRSYIGSWDFRVHPGGLESPLQVLQAIVNYGEALDPVLLPRMGFGVADMLQLAAEILDSEQSALTPAWNDQQVTLETPPAVTEKEVTAAGEYLGWWRSQGAIPAVLLGHPEDQAGDRLTLAARSLTVDSRRLSFDAGPNLVHVGPALFVQTPEGVLPLPSALVIESLMAAVARMLRLLPVPGEILADETDPAGPQGDSPAAVPWVTADEAAEAGQRWRDRADSDLAWACRALPCPRPSCSGTPLTTVTSCS